MLRRALRLVVLVLLCAGGAGCKLATLVTSTETGSSDGRSDDPASSSERTSESSSSSDESDTASDDTSKDSVDGWDEEDDHD